MVTFVTRDYLELNRAIRSAKTKRLRSFFSSLSSEELKWILQQISKPFLVKFNKSFNKYKNKRSIKKEINEKFPICIKNQIELCKIEKKNYF